MSPLPIPLVPDPWPDPAERALALLRKAILDRFRGRIALVSSFGADAAVLLHLVATVDPATPVVFLDTGKHFGETLRHRDRLVRRLGLADVRSVRPAAAGVATLDPAGDLWLRDPAACCALRKVEPLQRALRPFAAWINGRKRSDGGLRAGIRRVERVGGRVKLNPLAEWREADLAAYLARHGLPAHPLVEDGYRSIGCMPCTDRVADGEAARAGRWRGRGRTECGIHLAAVPTNLNEP